MKYLFMHLVLIFSLATATLFKYPGQPIVYILFTVLFNTLFLAGFRKNRIYFDTFFGTFLWLGFWMKVSVVLTFTDGKYGEAIGDFDGSGSGYDRALIIASIGAAGLLFATWIREKFIFKYTSDETKSFFTNLYDLYISHRKKILFLFAITVSAFAITNYYFGIYQRGTVPRTVLPFGLSGVYTWLLFFGFASFSAVFLNFELRTNKSPYLVAAVAIFESCVTNFSMYSRGMILNCSALFVGAFYNPDRAPKKNKSKVQIFVVSAFVILFAGSVFAVNFIRTHLFENRSLSEMSISSQFIDVARSSKVLLVDRWVGMEGMLAVSSHAGLGWDLFKKGLEEKYYPYGTTYYDHTIAKSPLVGAGDQVHFVSMPGIMAFFFYPGSYVFLLFSMFAVGLIGAGFELFTFKFGGNNYVLSALLSQVVAYRYIHFGYVPKQSYLLFGTIIINVFIFYFLEKATRSWKLRNIA